VSISLIVPNPIPTLSFPTTLPTELDIEETSVLKEIF